MKLEVGKKYLNSSREVVLITHTYPTAMWYTFADERDTFTEDGFIWRDKRDSPRNLVSEYTEDKVFKIEAGKYYISRDGNYKIGPVQEKGNDTSYPFWAKYKSLKTDEETGWWLTSDGRWDYKKDQDYRDAVAEYTEEKIFKVEAGKRYYTRNGGVTDAVNTDSQSSQPFTAKVYNKDNRYQGFKWFNENGHWLKERGESEWDLVKEYEEKKLTLPLEVGKKYVTVEGDILKIEKHEHFDYFDYIVQGVNDRGEFRMYYYLKTGEANIGECKYSLVSDYIEDSSELPKPEAKKEKKKPIKYSDLTFYEAWSLAKETKKRYRLKGSEWLEFPNVKVNKETFAKTEWEVEK